jgi:ribosomal protein L40E
MNQAAQITIRRASGGQGMLGALNVNIDGIAVTKVSAGKSVSFLVAPGMHSIDIGRGGVSSPTLSFQAQAGDQITFESGCDIGIIWTFLFFPYVIYCTLFRRKDFYWLRQSSVLPQPSAQADHRTTLTQPLAGVDIFPPQAEQAGGSLMPPPPPQQFRNTKMTVCESCGQDLSKDASTCPKCGAPNKKKRGWLGVTLKIIAICLVLMLIRSCVEMLGEAADEASKDAKYQQESSEDGK